jgi:YbbR domain-containing protein
MRPFLKSNLKLKGIALVLALLTWTVVDLLTNYPKTLITQELRVQLPEGWAVVGRDPSEFQILFQGTREDLNFINENSLEVVVDLSGESFDPSLMDNVRTVNLTPRNVVHNSRARVASIQPSAVRVRVGLEGQKQLPLRVNQTGELLEGLQVETITVEPQRVTLYGARDRLESVTALQTSPLNLNEKVGSFEQRVDVLLPSPDWVGRVEPSRVLVRVTLVGLTEDRLFTDIPVRVSHASFEPDTLNLVPEPAVVSVSLKGGAELLDRVDAQSLRAFVVAEEGRRNARVYLHHPPGLELLDVQPSTVRLVPRPEPEPTPPPPEVVEENAAADPES